MVTQLEKRYLLSSTLIIVSATHGQSATDPNRVRRIPTTPAVRRPRMRWEG
jgi:hypothetical protein